MLAAFSSLLVGSAAQLSSRLPVYLARLRLAQEHASGILRPFGVHTQLSEMLDPGSVLVWMASLAGEVALLLTNLVLALTIAGFLLLRFVRASASKAAAPTLRTERVRRAVREMYRYIAVKTVTSLATGLLIGGWLWVIDADLPILFGLIAFLLNYIPTLGSIVAGVTAVGVALLQHEPQHAGLVALGYLVINTAIGNVFEPRVMGRALGLWPVVVLVSVVFWGWLLGVMGAVLSALLTQTLKLLLLATPDLRAIGLALGPTSIAPAVRASQADLLEEAMPPSVRPPPATP
jgi:predicted PurR-regulated permease PerM